MSSLSFLVTQAVSGMVMSHGVDHKPNQILIGYSQKFCTTIALAYFSGRIDCRSTFCGWVGVHVSLLVVCRVSHCTEETRVWVKSLCSHQLNHCMFREPCRCCPQQWGPIVSCKRTTLCFSVILGCLGIFMGHSWPTTQLNVTQSVHWHKRCLVETPYPLLLEVLTRITLIDSRKFQV